MWFKLDQNWIERLGHEEVEESGNYYKVLSSVFQAVFGMCLFLEFKIL